MVSAAAGGVGALVTQLAINAGAIVIGTAGPANFDFLRSLGAIPVAHGDGQADRIKDAAPNGVDGYLDNFGDGNVEVAEQRERQLLTDSRNLQFATHRA